MTFELSCFGPVIIYCNGERVYKPNVLIERRMDLSASFTVQLKKGWNNFVLRFIRTNIGCGGILGAVSSRNRPQSFIVPSADREGQRGWLYTLPLKKPLEKLPEAGMTEEETGVAWYPLKDWLPKKKRWSDEKNVFTEEKLLGCRWTKLFAEKSGEIHNKGEEIPAVYRYTWTIIPLYESGKSGEFEFKTELKYGYYDLFVINQCGDTDWGFELDCFAEDKNVRFINPLNVKGTDDKWIYAGPFEVAGQVEPGNFRPADRPLKGAGCDVFWRLDKPHTVIRPYNDNKLFGHWNYPLGVTLYGIAEAGRFTEDNALLEYVKKHVEFCTRFFEYPCGTGTDTVPQACIIYFPR